MLNKHRIFNTAMLVATVMSVTAIYFPMQSIAQSRTCESSATWAGSVETVNGSLACVMRKGKKTKVFYFGEKK